MSKSKTIRAWKDPEYRASLTAEELAALPANPAGAVDLSDAELEGVSGAMAMTAGVEVRKRTPLCTTQPKTSVATGCTVTASYLPCKKAF